jgi:AraC-like DNA-binding protein
MATMSMDNYSIYFPHPADSPAWGAAVTGAGFARIPAGTEYPPRTAGHPDNHLFDWGRGRILDCYQIIFITEGKGVFESRETGLQRVGAGTLFLLFPGVWHRYRPDPRIGWVENWIELIGPVPDNLLREDVLNPHHAVMRPGIHPALMDLLGECHRLVQARPAGYAGQLAVTALHLLGHSLELADVDGRAPSRMDERVRQAQSIMAERCGQPFNVAELARELGVSGSHFRSAFQAHTGFSPRQYYIRLRLRQVQNLLRNSSMSLKEIASRLGYSSASHLSAEFKNVLGTSPVHWRDTE